MVAPVGRDSAGPVRVIPYNRTFYPVLCPEENFSVLYVTAHREKRVWFDILDPTGAHLLYHGNCERGVCATDRFCPTMDVLVRVSTGRGAQGTALLTAGAGTPCPPTGEWLGSIELRNASRPHLTGSVLRFDVRVLNPPDRLLAFKLVLRIRAGFVFQGFRTGLLVEQALAGDVLTITGDSSDSVLINGLLGSLDLLLEGRHSGQLRAVQVAPDGLQFMLGQHGRWFSVGVRGDGFSCLHGGLVDALADFPRPTTLIVLPQRKLLVHWRAVQDRALDVSTSIDVWAVWNTRGRPRWVQAECKSLTPSVLRVDATCTGITTRGAGTGRIRVRYLEVEEILDIRVIEPAGVHTRFSPDSGSRSGRLQVLARLLGHELDITPFVLTGFEEDRLACPTSFVGNISVGQPPLFQWGCAQNQHLEEPDMLYLLAGDWTARGAFQLRPSLLTPDSDEAGVLLFRQGELVRPSVLTSEDTSRAVMLADGNRIRLVKQGQSPRCVAVSDRGSREWLVAALPPSPASLDVQLSSTTLVVQQDLWKLVPCRATLATARLRFSDHTWTDVGEKLHWLASPLLQARQGFVETLFEAGVANVTFTLPGLSCVSASVSVSIHTSSVVSAGLVCPGCPSLLAEWLDPLSRQWPNLFPSAVPVDRFVVRRVLVDGTTHEALEPLEVTGTGGLKDEHVVASEAGVLNVSTAFTQQSVSIPVIQRWAVDWTLLCNGEACNPSVKLAPPGDGASLAPFQYLARLSLTFQLILYNGTVMRFDELPDVNLKVNGVDRPFPTVPLEPGELDIRVTFGPNWLFPVGEAGLRLGVHALASLHLDVPTVLYQLHCSRLWERGVVSLRARLTDGVEASVTQGELTTDGRVLRLDPTGAYLEAHLHGNGWVNASFAGMQTGVNVLAVMDSMLFTHLSLDAIPEVWNAALSTRLPLAVGLSPVVPTSDQALLFRKVVRWQASPPGIVSFLPTQELVLHSDYFESVVVQAIIRSCEGAPPIVFSKRVQVNVAPDQPWQVDFGDAFGRPLPVTPVGAQLSVPVFLSCARPLLAFAAVVSVQGLDTPSKCSPGELPFSQCSWQGRSVLFSGSFPASQHTGRLHLGTLHGTVLLNGLTRLRVSLKNPGNTTFEFTVRLGEEPVHSLVPPANSVQPGFSEPPVLNWQSVLPERLEACCDQVASRKLSNIAHLVPSSFRLDNISLQPGGTSLHLFDPRLQVEFDPLVLDFDADTGGWTVQPMALQGVTSITLKYQHPRSLERLETSVTIVVAEPKSLLISSSEVVLKRLHCSKKFQSAQLNASLLLDDGTRIALADKDIENHAIVRDPSTATVEGFLFVTGLDVGETILVLSMLGMTVTSQIRVLDESVVLLSSSMPDPYVLTSEGPLRIAGELVGGERLQDAAFLSPTVTTGPSALWMMDGRLIPVSNTHPGETSSIITAVIPACEGRPALVVSSRLVVRLQARLDHTQSADIVVEPSPAGFNVTLAADSVSAFLIHLHTGPVPVSSCTPGQDLPSFSDCLLDSDGGGVLIAGAFGQPRRGPVRLVFLAPMPSWINGYIEFFSGLTSCVRLPVVAGRFGNVSRPTESQGLPAVDPATVSRQYARALGQPWDPQAMQDARFALQVLVGRQRLVDARLYSNEFELSAMFRVLDRFLRPDATRSTITVTFHTRKLPAHPSSTDVPDGVSIPAQHVVDGWYAVQWVDRIPHLRVQVSYTVTTSASSAPWEHVIPEPLVTGRPQHECPRSATDRASFLVLYRIPPQVPGATLACAAQVAPRRVSISEPDIGGLRTASIALESFIRMQRAHLAITSMFDVPRQARRLFEGIVNAERVGLLYINDTADPAIPCPLGTYYSQNGTYERLPLHATAGPECYGMSCLPGYSLLGHECVPSAVSLDLVWVCVCVILGLILCVSCILCALHMGRKLPPPQPLDLASESWPGSSHPSEPFVDDETDQQFKNILLGSYIDDYSREILDDEFASIPFEVRPTESCRQASK